MADAESLRLRLTRKPIVVVPGVYDAFTALVGAKAGFTTLYVSGAAIAYTRLGRPDIGLVSMSEVADTVALIRDRVDVHLIVDADTGYGNALNVVRTVRCFEQAGASAIQLEDQDFPKRCGHLDGKALIPAQEMCGKIRAALDADGVILAIDDRYFHDQGAYVRTHAARVIHMTAGILPGPYRVPAYRAIGHFRLTNKTPAATYRAPGRYETTFVRERLVDVIAHKLKIDRIALRRRNAIGPQEMPYPRPLEALGEEIQYDSGDYVGLLDKLLATAGWAQLNAAVTKRKAQGELVGIGLAMFVEKSGLGPTDGVRISVDTSGMVDVVTGGASLGQGFETVMAQVAADALGVDYRRCRVIHGQTDRIPFGIGAHASRATVMTASATHIAALNVRRKALEIAAELLQAAPDALDIIDGEVLRKDAKPGPSISLATIAQNLAPTAKARGDREPGLAAEGWFKTEHQVYPYGSHIAVVRVDAETGRVAIERYWIAYDIGRAINPALVRGQIVGGYAQGVGGALFEEFTYSERGDPLAVTFADYLLPALHEIPTPDVLLQQDYTSPLNPLGIKGAGESGITAVGATIASAIDDAIGIPGAVRELPVTPQRLKRLLAGR